MNKQYKPAHFASPTSGGGALTAIEPARSLPSLAAFNRLGRQEAVSPKIFVGALRASELVMILASGLLAAAMHVGASSVLGSLFYPVAIAGTALATIILFDMLGLYRRQAIVMLLRSIPRLLTGWTTAVGLLTAALFFLKAGPEFSRLWLAAWWSGVLVLLLVGRSIAASIMRRWAREGRLNRHAVIVGGGGNCLELIRELEKDTDTDLRIAGIFDDRGDERSPAEIAGYPKLGQIEDVTGFARENRVDLVLISLPISAEERLLSIAKVLRVLPIDVRLSVAGSKLRFRPSSYEFIGRTPFIALSDKPISDWGLLAKNLLDKTVAAVALVALAPLMVGVAAAIRCESRGPILFRQKRYGFNNELIEVLKFRSMYVDKCDADATRLVTKEDPRVTRVGRFIRRTSIDELPQLFNVLRGELSLVGPRPHAVKAKAADLLYDQAVDGYFARHRVKPGITGWAQINGWRGETDTTEKIQKRVEHDLDYIENWSLMRDIYILLRTPLALLKSDGAY
jgi:Undecaprenyl-phosphate glucose phosphotransferase